MKKWWVVLAVVAVLLTAAGLSLFFGNSTSHRFRPWYVGLTDVKVVRDVNYTDRPPVPSHRLDLVVPTNVNGPLPVIVWIHGGAWRTGDKLGCPGAPCVKSGFAFASINYRFAQESVFPAQIYDCKAAIRWLRAHAREYNLDPERIGVWGQSAGGHLCALLGTTCGVKQLEGDEGNNEFSSCVQAVCNWCGPTDLYSIASQCGPDWGLDLKSEHAPQFMLVGGKNKEKLLAASPASYVGAGAAPVLIMHGDLDNVVPLVQSEDYLKALKKAGVDARLTVVKGAGHSFGDSSTVETVLQFFDEKLRH